MIKVGGYLKSSIYHATLLYSVKSVFCSFFKKILACQIYTHIFQ